MRNFLLLGTALLLSWQSSAQVVKQAPAPTQSHAIAVSNSQLKNTAALSNASFPEYWPDRVFIKLKNQDISIHTFEKQAERPARLAYDRVNSSLRRYATQRVSELPRSSKAPSLRNTYEVVLQNPEQLNQMMQEFKLMPEVAYVERVPYYVTHTPPNDPEYVALKQYAMARIKAVEAFGIHKGTSKTLIAIVDDAALITHPDLAANIDVARSYDVADRDNNPNPPSNGINKAGPNTFSHGTHCAGIAGAVTNNAVGISSVSNNKISIIGIKCTSDETANTRSIERSMDGILHAINQGARVISMSFGGAGRSQTMQNIINEASANGVVFVASAGNDNEDGIKYPAGYDNVIAVASSDDKDLKSSFSNYGSWVDITAPGTGIVSTVAATNGTGGAYISYNGTSMSTPMVAGMIALMLSENPNLTAAAVEEILKTTADNIDYVPGQSPTYAGKLGAGRINAFKAIQAIQALSPAAAPSSITDLSIVKSTKTEVELSWTAQGQNGNGTATQYDIRYSTSPLTTANFGEANRSTTNIKPATTGTPQAITVRNLEPNTTYYFAIVARSFYGDGSDISNVVTARTLDAPRVQTDASAIDIAINRDEVAIAKKDLLMRNIGALPLNYSIIINPIGGSNIKTFAKPKKSADGKVGIENSSFITAVKFTGGPRGLNLTHVQNFINSSTTVSSAAIGIKILKGGTNPANATLLTSQTTNAAIPSGGDLLTFKLNEPQLIGPGETFWVAFVLPAGLEFPQGYDNTGSNPETFYLSQDEGKTYSDAQNLAAFLNKAAFKIQAVDAHWLSLTPASDIINSDDNRNLILNVDTKDVVNGTYQADLMINSDDPITPSIRKTITLTITGGLPKLSEDKAALDFGSLFVGASSTKKINISNTGVASLVISEPSFSTGNYPKESFTFSPSLPITILPGTQQEVSIAFTPGIKEALAGNVTLTSSDPDATALTVSLKASLLNPPVVSITPELLNVTVIKAENPSKTEEIVLYNNGEANLDYNLLVQLNTTEVIKYDPDDAPENYIGYNSTTVPFWSAMKFNVTAPSFILTNVENYYNTMDSEDRTVTVRIYKDGYTPTAGTLLLEQTFNTELSATNGQRINIPLKEALSFAKHDVFWVVFTFNGESYPQGRNRASAGTGRNYYSQNGTTWTDFKDGTFKIRALGVTSNWLNATPVTGSVATGEKSVSAQINASNLSAGNYTGKMLVRTNDPAAPEKTVTLNLTVIESSVTGMEDEADAAKFYIYPNPTATGKVKLDLTVDKKTDVRVRLYNLTGQMLLDKTSKNTSGVYQDEISLKGLSSGLYLLQVQYGDKVFTRRLLISQ